MQTTKRKRYQKDTAPTDDIINLIQLVKQNPALYNYKLQPNQRRRIDILNGWAHIAQQIGNKYTVEECRRKWKNLRDTYHQYRLRKPKVGDGLAKWRYAKDLHFLSNIYQPKLKSQRQPSYDPNSHTTNLLHGVHETDDVAQECMSHSTITLVSDDAETFILTAYEESVNDDVSTIDQTHVHDSHSLAHGIELTHHDAENVEEIIKQEHTSSLDDDATGAEVDYEEVCLYEEGNAPSVDCETIIPRAGGLARNESDDSGKEFQFIDTNDFCIGTINTNTQLTNGTMATTVSTTSGTALINTNVSSSTVSSPFIHVQSSPANEQAREELDLFFDFLKKKMQHFSKEDLTALQVEFLKIVLQREADCAERYMLKTAQ